MLLFSEILILGGHPAKYTMEYYSPGNPEQNRVAKQRMSTARGNHISALVANGHVLTAGGWGENERDLSSTELFDPHTGQVQAGPSMAVTREGAAAAMLAGSIYVCGGSAEYLEYLSACGRFH